MIKLDLLKGGKKYAVTMSYDDGNEKDSRLIDIFNEYGIKSTFHLNSNSHTLSDISIYDGHEIACHGTTHASFSTLPVSNIYSEIFENRLKLENMAKYIIRGHSYANGSYTNETVCALKSCGIVYSRTTKSTERFNLPEDFLLWNPTCHHNKSLELAQIFLKKIGGYYASPQLLYIWGHSHELKSEKDWDLMKMLCEKISENKDIWYATNIEIYEYVQAAKSLIISADNHIVTNPSMHTVWFSNDGEEYKIEAGQTINI